ncbi:unnamed protein product, partial [Callosobruchus maculatus]
MCRRLLVYLRKCKVAPFCLPVHIQLTVPADVALFLLIFLLCMHTGLNVVVFRP